MSRRTYSRDQWTEAQALWLDFSDDWKPYRHQAAMRGILYPPEGTRWDSWEDNEPSQRAMLYRAIRDTPKLLAEAIARASSWGDVIAYVLRRRDEWREEIAQRDRDTERRKAEIEGEPRDAATALKAILNRISDS